MNIPFSKMSGSGNDFILINNFDGKMNGIDLVPFVQKVCTRSVSVGADGVILLEPSDKADFKWQFFNSDGSVAEMCGNGSRCAARFAFMNGIAGRTMTFETLAGIIHAEIKTDPDVKVQLTPAVGLLLDEQLPAEGRTFAISSVNTGVPHAVIFDEDIEAFDIMKYGPAFRYHEHFKPKGTNVNITKVVAEDTLRVRTYERGVEGETLACGTGSVACAMISIAKNLCKSPVTIITSSGIRLKVYVENGENHLEGEARLVYTGTLTPEAYSF